MASVIQGHAGSAIAQRLQAYDDAIGRLPLWAHASWYAARGLTVPPAAGSPQGSPATAPLLAVALGVGLAEAAAFDRPAHRLAALPPGLLCRVLRARGLLRRRPALRQCLDTAMRARLVDWLYPSVFEAVLRESADSLHRDATGLPLPPARLAAEAPDRLAWEGFCLFQRDGTWTDRAVLRLLRLGFPEAMPLPAGLDDTPGAPEGSAWVLRRLDRFVPEAPWLCG